MIASALGLVGNFKKSTVGHKLALKTDNKISLKYLVFHATNKEIEDLRTITNKPILDESPVIKQPVSKPISVNIKKEKKSKKIKVKKKLVKINKDISPIEKVRSLIKTTYSDSIVFVNEPGFLKSKDFLKTFEWRRLRMDAIEKYGNKCMCCGAGPAQGATINVDHIKPRKTNPELAMDFNNLQILCGECNHGKGNKYDTDWRI